MTNFAKARIAAMLLTGGLLGTRVSAGRRGEHPGTNPSGRARSANSTVTLWVASVGDPRQLAQTQSGGDGSFDLSSGETLGADVSLYSIAKGGVPAANNGGGDNPAIALLTVLGNAPPAKVVINEMTTVASLRT